MVLKKSALISVFLLFCLSVSAQIREQKDGQIVASVGDRLLGCYAFQEQSNWCWAASLQMILAYHKIHVSQKGIVKRVFQNAPNRAATSQEMVQAINGYVKGKRQVICYADSVINMRNLIGEIEEGNPVVVGMEYQGRQHAMVLTQILFQKVEGHAGKIIPVQVTVVDPSRMYLKERRFSWEEFYRQLNMVLHVIIADNR